MQQVGWLPRESSGEESLLFSWQTRKADMPHRPCQDILKPLQSACTITDIHINYSKTLRYIRHSLTDVSKMFVMKFRLFLAYMQ